MMLEAKKLRENTWLIKIDAVPGYYKWWAHKAELDTILSALNVNFADICDALETKDDMFCIYVGIAVKESVRERLNWHVNDKHTESQVRNGTLSTLRQSIASIVAQNQRDKTATNAFIDKLSVEWFYSVHPIKSLQASDELHKIERTLLAEHLYVLKIQEKAQPLAAPVKRKLKRLRKASKPQA